MNTILRFLRTLFGLPSATPPTIDQSDPCNAPVCVDAKHRLDAARDGFDSVCNGLRMLRDIAGALRKVASTPVWVTLALAIIATLLELWVLSIICWVLVAVYVVSWLPLPVIQRMAGALAATLEQRRIAFAHAVADVVAQCPESCRGDLSDPQCQLQ